MVEKNGERFCLNRMEAVAVVKVDNIKRHFNSKHALTLKAFFARQKTGKKASEFKKKHPSQKSVIVKMDSAPEKATYRNGEKDDTFY